MGDTNTKPTTRSKSKNNAKATQPKINGYFTKKQDNTPVLTENLTTTAQSSDVGPSKPQSLATRSTTPAPLHVPKKEIIYIPDSSPEKSIPFKLTLKDSYKASGTPSSPIFLSSAAPTPIKPQRIVHPFFQPRKPKEEPSLQSKTFPSEVLKLVSQATSPQDPSWPDLNSLHCFVAPPGITPRPATFPPRSLERRDPATVHSTGEFSKWLDAQQDLQVEEMPVPRLVLTREQIIDGFPEDHTSHPAIRRLLFTQALELSRTSAQIWNEKYAPINAESVLRNSNQASFLKAWLQALSVGLEHSKQTTSAPSQSTTPSKQRPLKRPRPQILRAVEKKGRKRRKLSDDSDELNDFIVDDEEEEGYFSTEGDPPRTMTAPSVVSRSPSPLPVHFPLLKLGTRSRPSAKRTIRSPTPDSPLVPAIPLSDDLGGSIPEPARDLELGESMTNTILLTGPCGSGKTATVYACARELHWKVFEVYPGGGKRSGAGFLNEVGGTAENHRVGIKPVQEASLSNTQDLSLFTSPSKKNGIKSKSIDLQEEDYKDVHQSLILVEEVDILFQADVNFWPTLINFIKKSKRPVVLTCNDKSPLPLKDLPLQNILEFHPCEIPLATTYLQVIALAEGHILDRQEAEQIYTEEAVYRPLGADIPDQPLHPLPTEPRPQILPDLRRAINQLQFACATSKSKVTGKGVDLRLRATDVTVAELADWHISPAVLPSAKEKYPRYRRKKAQNEEIEVLLQMSELLDAISFTDAYVDRRVDKSLEIGSIDRFNASGDDVQGYSWLDKVCVPEEAFGLAWTQREEWIAAGVAYHARQRFEQDGTGKLAREFHSTLQQCEAWNWGFDVVQLAIRRAVYQKRVVQGVDEIIDATICPLMPSPALLIEYLPQMVTMARGKRGSEWMDRMNMSEEGKQSLLSDTLIF